MRVFQYGLRSPTVGADLVREQMLLAHRYCNAMIEQEIARRDDIRARERTACLAEVLACDVARGVVETALTALRAERIARGHTAILHGTGRAGALVDSPHLVDALRAARAVEREADAAFAAARKAAKISAPFVDRKPLRHEYSTLGLRHGTYILCEDRVHRALEQVCSLPGGVRRAKPGPLPLWWRGKPLDPRWRRWTGEGQVSVQIQGGCSVARLLAGEDTRVQLLGDGIYRTLRLRIGTDPAPEAKRAPVWAEWPMKLHRPLPEGGTVKVATVSLRRRGPALVWTAELSVDCDEIRDDRPARGVCGLDLGWRRLPKAQGGVVRVGSWVGDDGAHGEIVVPPELERRLRYPQALRAIRCRALDRLKEAVPPGSAEPGSAITVADVLPHWIATHAPPEWRAERCRDWRSPERWARLLRRWLREPIADGEWYLAELRDWERQDRHLWQWEDDQRARAERCRREIYRVAARDLARRYRWIAVEKLDLRAHSHAPEVGEELGPDTNADMTGAEYQRQASMSLRVLAAPSDLRKWMRNAFCADLIEVLAAGTSEMCPDCGHSQDVGQDLRVTCVVCGRAADRDERAARNILARGRERADDDKEPGSARRAKRQGKWAKTKSAKAKKRPAA